MKVGSSSRRGLLRHRNSVVARLFPPSAAHGRSKESGRRWIISGHHIHTIRDLIRILRDQPEWREELRCLILTEELLALPVAFERFREEEFSGRLISRGRLVPREQRADILEDAFDEGRINENEQEDALLIDLVVRGRLRHDKNRDVLFAAEVSVEVDRHDVERAARRAAVIGRAHGLETIAVGVGKDRTEGTLEAAEALDVVLIV